MSSHPPTSGARVHQILFSTSILTICWIAMMSIHELGHVIGAVVSGGKVQCVVLHPLSISRTDVAPNPHPGVVVWSGPILGCVLPLLLWTFFFQKRQTVVATIVRFYCGFCLIANGAYIGVGSFDQVGDCKQMLQSGSPPWTLILFGLVTVPCGFAIWHRLGSIQHFWNNPAAVPSKLAIRALAAAAMTVFASLLLTSQ